VVWNTRHPVGGRVTNLTCEAHGTRKSGTGGVISSSPKLKKLNSRQGELLLTRPSIITSFSRPKVIVLTQLANPWYGPNMVLLNMIKKLGVVRAHLGIVAILAGLTLIGTAAVMATSDPDPIHVCDSENRAPE